MFLLAAILTVVWCGGLTEAVANCSGVTSGYRCDSCAAVSVCSGGQASGVLANCQAGQVCEEDVVSGTGTCFDATTAANKCQCSTAPAFLPDPYDISGARFMVCIVAGSPPILQSCPSGQVFSDVTNSCIDAPIVTTLQPPTCTGFGIFPTPDGCSGYYVCFPNGSGGFISQVVYCNTGETFDPTLAACTANAVTVPPSPATCPAGSPIVMDAVECNAFYVCDGNGDVLGEALCCPPDKIINVATMKCEDESSAVQCPALNPCYTGDYVRKCAVATEPTPTVMMPTTSMTCHTDQ